jgi:hypothetical protein
LAFVLLFKNKLFYMKTTIKLFITAMLSITTLTNVQTVSAQRPGGPGPGPREDAKTVIHRTSGVIIEGQRDEARGRVYTGDNLSASIAHQHLAIRLFQQGKFERAINQSIRARNLAFAVIRANRGVIRPEWQFNAMEQGYVKRAPAEADLDAEVRTGGVDMGLKDEKAAGTSYSDLDINVNVK